jgi:oxygen-dependent protoporphyrinogen oxidase
VAENEIIVVGAGIAGLACATELATQGRDVIVLEAAERVGGPVETRRDGELTIERGPQTVRSTPELETLFARAGLRPIAAERRPPYVLRNGRLIRVPPSLGELARGTLVSPLSLAGGLLGEPFRRHRCGPMTVHEMVQERFGKAIAEALADVLTLGVYSQPADRIGFESAFPALADNLDRYGSLLIGAVASRFRGRAEKGSPRSTVSAEDGLGALMGALGALLGKRVRLRTAATRVERTPGGFRVETSPPADSPLEGRHVVLAVPPPQAARLLSDDRVARLLDGTALEPQTLAQFVTKDTAAVERWRALGFLVPARERLPIIGCLFPSSFFPGRAPSDVLLQTVFVERSLRDESDATLAREIGGLLSRLLGTPRAPELVEVARYPVGIPIYDRRHRDRTRAVRRRLADEGGPLLAGAGYDGVGLGTAATSGIAAARAILAPTGSLPSSPSASAPR